MFQHPFARGLLADARRWAKGLIKSDVVCVPAAHVAIIGGVKVETES